MFVLCGARHSCISIAYTTCRHTIFDVPTNIDMLTIIIIRIVFYIYCENKGKTLDLFENWKLYK